MTNTAHKIFISLLISIVILTLVFLFFMGISYYRISIEERFYHPAHNLLKPSGILGHGMGILGSLFMIIGMGSYMVRKRYRILSRMGLLKHWLEFHIFLCTLGPILILFHTTYKFGGLVAVSFWSMVAVFLSGVIGRFIYIQIPHTIEGRELSLNEVRDLKSDVVEIIKKSYNLDEESYAIIGNSIKKKVELYHKYAIVRYIRKYFNDQKSLRAVKKVLKENNLPRAEYMQVLELIEDDIMLNRKIEQLDLMQNLFKYWHVAHLPFALVMLIIMFVHVGVTILFGYRWIF
jgi:sulfur relay (sulfurtransferase) DsrC/TusE family protein